MARRLTTEEFIEKARSVHGDRYDYSSVSYVSSQAKVTIICPEHGPFPQKPNKHLSRRGCPDCGGRKQLTTETFIERAIAIRGDLYDYSQVEYVSNKKSITIICAEHGPFPQTPADHVNSEAGCPDCAGTKRLTTSKFIERAMAVHGNRYDYSQVEYVNNRTYVTIICREHGSFPQTPDSHFAKHGCPDCAGLKPLTTETFIERAIAVHGDRYDYSQVEYVNNKTYVTITCPEHGPFPQKPNSHLATQGCPDCAGKNVTTETFIEKAIEVHGDRYDYSQVKYVDSKSYVTIICREHGLFGQVPSSHLQHIGCPDCGGRKQLTTEKFIEMAMSVHGDRYDYSSVRYANAHAKVTIICREHGPFLQKPNSHLAQASGCPDCADSGFNPSEIGLLYYIAITTDDGDTRYKIGITNNSVEERFRGRDLARIRTVKIWRYAIGRSAAEREAEILRQHKGDKYYGPDILVSAGNTELFTHDVLGLDKENT